MSPHLLSHLPPPSAPPHLLGKVLETIERARLRTLRIRATFSLASLLAVGSYVFADWSTLKADLDHSSFFEFVRLTLSDPDLVLQSSQDFILGVLESLPLEIILLSLLGGFFVIGILLCLQELRRSHKSSRLSLSH